MRKILSNLQGADWSVFLLRTPRGCRVLNLNDPVSLGSTYYFFIYCIDFLNEIALKVCFLLRLNRLSSIFTYFYPVLLGFTYFYLVLLCFTQFNVIAFGFLLQLTELPNRYSF